jgi:hypothetical protein
LHIRFGSKCEELSVGKCLPGYTQKRISLDTAGMPRKCHKRQSSNQFLEIPAERITLAYLWVS